ncbi:MAG: Patatin family protein [uncultured Aureispira sp.]|uniref:Patatin family protein n=1 Tax=uncultured Aureispira sp. TaxID=1331704 RepID=A0A6S6U3R3_9BACT|nr:MAG: Patatin family protein [uncultured Aureispira sp.]
MKALICEGGGFKTAFTAGVLDAWISAQYAPFDIFLGVSGGAAVMACYTVEQYKRGWELVSELHSDSSLTSFSRFVKGGYFLELDLIDYIWDRITPFDKEKATQLVQNKIVEFACTDLHAGVPIFIRPAQGSDWKRYLRATSTLPYVSECPLVIDEQELVDGVFAAPIPVQRAIELGATDITVIRTNSDSNTWGTRRSKMMSNYLLKNNFPAINQLMQKEDEVYKQVADLIKSPPKGVSIQTIVPQAMQSKVLSTKAEALKMDYRAGLEDGLDFLRRAR